MIDKLNQAAMKVAAKGAASLMAAKASKNAAVAGTAAVAGVLVAAPAAFAADNAIDTIFTKIKTEALQPFYTGMLTIIGLVALIFLIKELIQGATSSAGSQRSSHVQQCLVILVICIIMGFAPTIIQWVLDFGNAGIKVDLPTAPKADS